MSERYTIKRVGSFNSPIPNSIPVRTNHIFLFSFILLMNSKIPNPKKNAENGEGKTTRGKYA